MNYRLIPSTYKSDLDEFKKKLSREPRSGVPLGGNAYKHRLAVKSKGRGKSGGMRVITYLTIDLLIDENTNIYKDELRRLIGDLR